MKEFAMTTDATPATSSAHVVDTDRATVTNIRIGKRGHAIELGKGLLKRAGWRPGAKLQATVMSDGSVVLRRESGEKQPHASDASFEQVAADVLENRRDLLERLAQ
jgi:hypothetical protein